MQSPQHLINIILFSILLLWSLQSVGVNEEYSETKENMLSPQTQETQENTPPKIKEGEKLELILQEDNSKESSDQPTAYPIILNASDDQNDKLSWIATTPQHGTIDTTGENNTQTINYTPDLHYHGTDTFKVQVSDTFNNIDEIEISIVIESVNDAPSIIVKNKYIEISYDSPIQAYDLNKHFYDVDNKYHEMRYEIVENTDPNVVHAKIRKNFLYVTYKQVGNSDVSVKIIDPYDSYAVTYFHIAVIPVISKIELSHSFPPLSQIFQPVTLFFQISSESGVNPTGLVTVSNNLQSCHYKLEPTDQGQGSCRMDLTEYRDYVFHAEYEGDSNFTSSSTQKNFIHRVQPNVLIYHTKPRKEYELSEDGMGDSYEISLSEVPTKPVILTVTPDSQLTVNNAEAGQAVTFSLEDTLPINIFLIPVDDQMVEGWHYGKVQHHTQSKDKDYHNLISSLSFPIQDNDAGIVIKQTDGSSKLKEEETTDNYSVYLSTSPQKPVNIKIIPYDTQAITHPRNLIFDTENWYQAQNVQISAFPDILLEDEHFAMFSHIVRTRDPIYIDENLPFSVDGENTNTIDVRIMDNDAEQPPFAPSELTAKLLIDNQILLNWEDNSDNEDSFILTREGIKLDSLPENSRYYQDIEVRCDTTYTYELFSINKKGHSAKSTKTSIQTVPCSELQAPDKLTSIIINDQYVNLFWYDTNNSEAGYIIERNGREMGRTNAHTVGYRDEDFACSMTYMYVVKAYGFNGEQSPPAHSTIQTSSCKGKFTLTLKIEGLGSINGCTEECVQIYPDNQILDVQIQPQNNWEFDHWEGDCNSKQIIMDSDKLCIAHFTQISE